MALDGRSTAATLHRGWLAAFCSYALVLGGIFAAAYLRLIPTRLAAFPFFDTLGHFVLMGLAALLLDLAWRSHRTPLPFSGRHQWAIPSAALAIGLVASVDEFAQLLSSARTFDPADLIASLAGVLIFCQFHQWLRLRREP